MEAGQALTQGGATKTRVNVRIVLVVAKGELTPWQIPDGVIRVIVNVPTVLANRVVLF